MESKSSKSVKGDAARFHVLLWRLNVAVCAVHFCLALWILVSKFALNQDWEIPVATSFVSWHKSESTKGCGGEDNGNCYVSHEIIVFKNLSRISLSGLVMAFHFLSFSWQLVVVVNEEAREYYMREIRKGQNVLRWLEYSLSAPLMIIVISVLLGIVDVVVLALLAVCTCALMGFGYLQETTVLRNSRTASAVPHGMGWILFVLTWSAISFVFWVGLRESDAKPPSGILPVIYSVYFLMISLFGCFGFVQASQVWQGRRRDTTDVFKYKVEAAYVILSLVSKATLGVLVFWGITVRDSILVFN
jgi:hypothetical protein